MNLPDVSALPPTGPEQKVRIRLYIDGKLEDEVFANLGTRLEDLAEEHLQKVEEAIRNDVLYLVELFDPLAPEDQAYIRWGTDTRGMVAPVEASPEEFLEGAKKWADVEPEVGQ